MVFGIFGFLGRASALRLIGTLQYIVYCFECAAVCHMSIFECLLRFAYTSKHHTCMCTVYLLLFVMKMISHIGLTRNSLSEISFDIGLSG